MFMEKIADHYSCVFNLLRAQYMICIFFFVGGWNEIDWGQWLTNDA